METIDSDELGFESSGSLLDYSSSGILTSLQSEKILGMTVDSEPIYNHHDGESFYFDGGCDPLVSMAQNLETRTSLIAAHDKNNSSSSTHSVWYQLDRTSGELMPNFPHIGSSSSFSEMDSLFTLQKCHLFGTYGGPSDYTLEQSGDDIALTSRSTGTAQFQEGSQILHEGSMDPSANVKKRKRVNNEGSQGARVENVDMEQPKDEITGERNDERCKYKEKPVLNMAGTLLAKENIDSSHGKKARKEEFVHMRAKHGQATSSHSLAERVRRERISERMKFLQNLVPGCSQITGRAVMLDEIINYVLSLQRQIEFLSRKLALVYPRMVVDIERLPSTDIHHSQGHSAAFQRDTGVE